MYRHYSDLICGLFNTVIKRDSSALRSAANSILRAMVENDLLAYSVFHDLVFDGEQQLRRQVSRGAPSDETLNTIILYLVNKLSNGNPNKQLICGGFSAHHNYGANLATPEKITAKYIRLLTGTKLPPDAVRKRYKRALDAGWSTREIDLRVIDQLVRGTS